MRAWTIFLLSSINRQTKWQTVLWYHRSPPHHQPQGKSLLFCCEWLRHQCNFAILMKDLKDDTIITAFEKIFTDLTNKWYKPTFNNNIIIIIIILAETYYTYTLGAHVLAICSNQNVFNSRDSILYSIPFRPISFRWEPFCGRRLQWLRVVFLLCWVLFGSFILSVLEKNINKTNLT